MEGASGPIEGPRHWHLARETRQLSWLLKYTVQAPALEGMHTGPGLGLGGGTSQDCQQPSHP